MTIEQILGRIVKANVLWYLTLNREIRTRAILDPRAAARYPTRSETCPLCFLAGISGNDFEMARRILKLDAETACKIVCAVDRRINHFGESGMQFTPSLRRMFLFACGLSRALVKPTRKNF